MYLRIKILRCGYTCCACYSSKIASSIELIFRKWVLICCACYNFKTKKIILNISLNIFGKQCLCVYKRLKIKFHRMAVLHKTAIMFSLKRHRFSMPFLRVRLVMIMAISPPYHTQFQYSEFSFRQSFAEREHIHALPNHLRLTGLIPVNQNIYVPLK